MKLAFWNVGRVLENDLIGSFMLSVDADIIFFAELDPGRAQSILISTNNKKKCRFYFLYEKEISSIVLITRYPRSMLQPISDFGRFSLRELYAPLSPSVLLVAVHIPSKIHASADDQAMFARLIREEIERAETKVGHARTVVIGDFNCNPYEKALLAVDAFNATMDKSLVTRASRKIQGKEWSSFYNPMWSLLGDESKGTPGTFFYRSGGTVNPFWNMFDQILLRPDLLPYFSFASLMIHDMIDNQSLLRKGCIDITKADHLPVSLDLQIEGVRND